MRLKQLTPLKETNNLHFEQEFCLTISHNNFNVFKKAFPVPIHYRNY